MNTGLTDKVVLITGGGSGIGRAACLAFADEGAAVVVADLAVDGGEETAALVRQVGGNAVFQQADVARAADVQALVEMAVRRFGRLDCALNNAGIAGPTARAAECSEQEWDDVLNVNLKGVWLCMKYELAEMLAQHAGVIVNTTSAAGLRGSRFSSAYAASNHGVIGLTQSAALEYAAEGIRINAICPGIVDTPMIQRRIAGDAQRAVQFNAASPLGRMAAPEEIARAMVWLCSDAAAYVNGHVLVVDGGRLAQ